MTCILELDAQFTGKAAAVQAEHVSVKSCVSGQTRGRTDSKNDDRQI